MSKCPGCGFESDFNYRGFLFVECINPRCNHYSDKARKTYDKEVLPPPHTDEDNPFEQDEDTDPMWVFGIKVPRDKFNPKK